MAAVQRNFEGDYVWEGFSNPPMHKAKKAVKKVTMFLLKSDQKVVEVQKEYPKFLMYVSAYFLVFPIYLALVILGNNSRTLCKANVSRGKVFGLFMVMLAYNTLNYSIYMEDLIQQPEWASHWAWQASLMPVLFIWVARQGLLKKGAILS